MIRHPRLGIQVLLSGVFLILILQSCSSDNHPAVARIGSLSVSEEEYQRRFNFNSVFPPEVPISTQKELVLSSLLAEKVLSIYAGSDTLSTEVKIAKEQVWREVLIEELRQDSVERQISISESDLQKEYEKSLWDVNIKYLAFDDSAGAWQFYHNAADQSFASAARRYLDQLGNINDSIPQRRIVWGIENPDLENKVHDLGVGQVAFPFFVYGQYYVITCESFLQNASVTPRDFKMRRSALHEKLFKERVNGKYKNFYTRQIRPRLGKIQWKRLQPFYDALLQRADFENTDESQQPLVKPVEKEIYIDRRELFSALLKTDAIKFTDYKSLSVEKVVETLSFGPYVLDYSNARNFKKSFFNMVHLMLEHEVIYNLALDLSYDKNESVNSKMVEWNSYYSATEKKYQLINDADILNSQKVLDEFLMEKTAQLDIEIYPEVLKNIKLNPAGIVVRKSHFANRLVSAPIHNFMGLKSWETYIKSLLSAEQS